MQVTVFLRKLRRHPARLFAGCVQAEAKLELCGIRVRVNAAQHPVAEVRVLSKG